jgi:polyisoprenoid-binding protein YceI
MSDTASIERTFNGTPFLPAGLYNLDPAHTFTEFTAQHRVIGHVRGRFDNTTGKVTIAEEPTQSSLEVSIETASVSTHNDTRDKDLRSPRFFNVENFPNMTFRSTGIVPETDGRWTIEGELTIRNVTVAVPLSVDITGITADPSDKVRAGIRVQAETSRRDFGLLADLEAESGGRHYGKDVSITVYAELILHAGT